jgi:hypothetical protein
MEIKESVIKRKLAQFNIIYNYLLNNKVTNQYDIYSTLKIDSRLVSWLVKTNIIYKENGYYVWNPKLKPNAKMVETFQRYYLDFVRSSKKPKSSTKEKHKSKHTKNFSIRVFSLLWGLIKIENRIK